MPCAPSSTVWRRRWRSRRARRRRSGPRSSSCRGPSPRRTRWERGWEGAALGKVGWRTVWLIEVRCRQTGRQRARLPACLPSHPPPSRNRCTPAGPVLQARLRLKKEYDLVVGERDVLGTQVGAVAWCRLCSRQEAAAGQVAWCWQQLPAPAAGTASRAGACRRLHAPPAPAIRTDCNPARHPLAPCHALPAAGAAQRGAAPAV